MLLRLLHKAVAVAMAFLLLVSTTSWMVDTHYCMGHVRDIAFFKNADTCGMMMDMDRKTNPHLQTSKSCCSDELITLEGQDKVTLSFNDIQLGQQLFLAALTYTYLDLFPEVSHKEILQEHYPPPILVKDLLILDQVFRI